MTTRHRVQGSERLDTYGFGFCSGHWCCGKCARLPRWGGSQRASPRAASRAAAASHNPRTFRPGHSRHTHEIEVASLHFGILDGDASQAQERSASRRRPFCSVRWRAGSRDKYNAQYIYHCLINYQRRKQRVFFCRPATKWYGWWDAPDLRQALAGTTTHQKCLPAHRRRAPIFLPQISRNWPQTITGASVQARRNVEKWRRCRGKPRLQVPRPATARNEYSKSANTALLPLRMNTGERCCRALSSASSSSPSLTQSRTCRSTGLPDGRKAWMGRETLVRTPASGAVVSGEWTGNWFVVWSPACRDPEARGDRRE